MKQIFTVILLLSLGGCINWLIEPEIFPDGKILIINTSSKNIVYSFTMKNEFNNNDTLLHSSIRLFDDCTDTSFIVYANSNKEYHFYTEVMKDILENDVEMIYLFDLDTLNAYSWEQIAQGYKVLKRVDFDKWEDLEACDFTITYP